MPARYDAVVRMATTDDAGAFITRGVDITQDIGLMPGINHWPHHGCGIEWMPWLPAVHFFNQQRDKLLLDG
ncbi:hypothetical protein D3C72_2111300 [compost metagenome]